MRLIKQTKLYLREGKSDKVYEVDLCEAGEGEFVVNFRYGRRGTTLREGTKTTFPVSEAEAETVYQKLVESKTKKGYTSTHPDTGTATPAESQAADTEDGVEARAPQLADDPRAQRVLELLQLAAEGNPSPSGSWKLSRVLWRAGEMCLRDAIGYLVKIAATGDAMQDLSLAWALTRCGDSSCVDVLQDLHATTASAPARRFAEAGLLDLAEGSVLEKAIRERRQVLPASVAAALDAEPDRVIAAIYEALQRSWGDTPDLLADLYLLSPHFPGARTAVQEALRRIPFAWGSFKSVRSIYKLAELRNDSEVFGWLGYRFEKTPEAYRTSYGGLWHRDRWARTSEILAQPDSGLAYSYNTREYLRRRTLRTLRRYGELGIDLYAEMAAGVLLAFADEFDRKQPRKTVEYVWQRRRYQTVDRYFDVYDYPLLNHLLYRNSPRYEPQKGLAAWPCAGGYKPGQAAPNVREEAFPEIWDRNPDAVIRLLRRSACFAVHEFAVRVFRANPEFAKNVDINALVEILASPYEITAELAIDLAKRLYDPASPNLELVAALVTCPSMAGRALALGWIEAQPGVFFSNADFLQTVVFCAYSEVHAALRAWVPAAAVSSELLGSVALVVIDRILSLDSNPEHNERVQATGETLLAIAGEPLSRIETAIVLRLLEHPLDEVQALAGKLLLNHTTPAAELDAEVFEKLLYATSAAARTAGMELFGSLPDDVLIAKYAILASFVTCRQRELRQSVQPIVVRLASGDAGFARDMIEQCYPLLARKERFEDLHEDLYQLLVALIDHLQVIPPKHIDRLLDSKYRHAQELGGLLLQHHVDVDHVPMRRIVQLGSHESIAVRTWVQQVYTDHPARIKQELEESVRLVDATWDDTRDFAFDFFRNQLEESDWTPDVLVAISDSVNPLVQAFGRELITRFFSREHGQIYLLKLSQHPSPDLQLFASSYLERFAADNQERLASLELFFVTVLCQVNRGRVAKDRVLAFLRREALKREEGARLVARILTRQSATMAIGDKAACIATLREIQHAYPQLETPLAVREPAVWARD